MPNRSNHCYFHCARGFATPVLAHVLNSLVRVSRRGKENHFVSITSAKATDLGLSQDAEARYSTVKVYLPHHHMTQDKPMLTHARSQRPCRKQQEKYKRARHWFPLLPFQQFQVLFNSLFKVLCIFPSRYLYAIGLPPIFSFRWNVPPTLSCNPKQLDSLKAHAKAVATQARTGVSPSQLPFSKGLGPERPPTLPLQTTIRCTLRAPRGTELHRFTR